MSYEDVYVDPKVLEESKVHPTIIIRAVNKWKANSSNLKKRGPNDKWMDVVDWEGVRYAINFRNEIGDKCVVIGFRKAHYSKTFWETKRK